jgi:hypothetical protein
MNTGLTIAFVNNNKTKDKLHSTVECYNKFGNKYWDDTLNNRSKIGYYFAYYFQKKYVYIHKIINILQPCERPIEMDWSSDKQILCLSNRLKKFTWEEWKNGIGLNAPYTPDYHINRTNSWSCYDLQRDKKFKHFDFIKFKNSIETPLNSFNQSFSEPLSLDTNKTPSVNVTTQLSIPSSILVQDEEVSEDEDDIDEIIKNLIRCKVSKKIKKNVCIVSLQQTEMSQLQLEEIRLNNEKDELENSHAIKMMDLNRRINNLKTRYVAVERGDFDDELIEKKVKEKVEEVLAVADYEKK